MKALKRKSGALMQMKRSFSSLPNPRVPRWQNPGLQGRKGAYRLHENAETQKLFCGAGDTLRFAPPNPPFSSTCLAKAGRWLGAGEVPSIPLPLLSRLYCISRETKHRYCLYLPALHAGPRGRRTSPACGSFRRPLNYNAGIN